MEEEAYSTQNESHLEDVSSNLVRSRDSRAWLRSLVSGQGLLWTQHSALRHGEMGFRKKGPTSRTMQNNVPQIWLLSTR